MANQYKAISWNNQKRIYDRIIIIFCVSFLIFFSILNLILRPEITLATLLIRAFGLLALILLHIVLVIGPLTRINSSFLPLLYNRRHLGVAMFIAALTHGLLSIIQFHGFGNENPFISVFTSNTEYNSFIYFPFETLGFGALIIFLFMAITSHDFWLHQLSPGVWKTLHMFVYLAYFLVVMHVMLGAGQEGPSSFLFIVILIGLVVVVGLHIYAAILSKTKKQEVEKWVKVGLIEDIPDNKAKTIFVGESKIAVFRYDNKLSAVSNYCRHQGGPLGEGEIVDGCITCPWHGYQYYPHNGCSPPPFTEKLETFELKLELGTIYVNPVPNEEGAEVIPIEIAN